MSRNIFGIVFIFDIANDLLEYILNGDQSNYPAILVNHDCHVVTAVTEFLQQNVEALALGNEHGGPQQFGPG